MGIGVPKWESEIRGFLIEPAVSEYLLAVRVMAIFSASISKSSNSS
jgi:hypothetical protein